jgi:DNA polymerase IV (archaeal DinB-like DNA polymerase)
MAIILHMDLDYFFAQVEELDHPEYKGKPVVVCIYSNRGGGSGAVGTSNYPARKYGVKSGLPLALARSLLKGVDAVFVPARPERYGEVSVQVMETLAQCGDAIEQASVDEAFLDITARCANDYYNAEMVAREAKFAILKSHGLSCSIGVGPNKLIAKIASDYKKPDGLTVVKPEGVLGFIGPMDAGKIPGIGGKTMEALSKLGIGTVAQLRNCETGALAEAFGRKMAAWLKLAANGAGDEYVGGVHERRQISSIETLKENTRDFGTIMEVARRLCREVVGRATEEGLLYGAAGIIMIDARLNMKTKMHTLRQPSGGSAELEKAVERLAAELLEGAGEDIRRVGVKIEKFSDAKMQKRLFD